MVKSYDPKDFLSIASEAFIVDVRSPGEFGQGHIPCAFNIPIYNDAERAVVGTLYVQSGKDHAILKGLDIALSKIGSYLSSIRKIAVEGKVLVHCWRGGLRSATMAQVFEKAGYEVGILEGGYKAYRRYIRTQLAVPHPVIVLGGYTGSGKTEILRSMSSLGAHVIDLEGLAHHKGSVFGSLGELPQPTNEQFENDLYDQWIKQPPLEPVWLEDESRMIGRVTLPEPVYLKISLSPMVKIDVDKNIRIQNLVNGYAGFDKSLLAEAISRISSRVGGDKAKLALIALDKGDFHSVAGIVLTYYDKAYGFALERRPGRRILEVPVNSYDVHQIAEMILDLSHETIIDECNLS